MSAIFEFDFIEPKPTTKVDSVFDLVNGNGQHHEDAELTQFETKLLGQVQAANERIEEFIAESASQIAPPWDEAPNLTPKDLLEGYSPANHLYQPIDAETIGILTNDETGNGLIVMPDLFEFMQSETLDYNETPETPAATIATEKVLSEEERAELEHQINLRKWERDYEQAKIDWDKTKRDTEQEQVSLALEVKRISDELKAVRQQHKSVISFLEDLNKTGPDYPERPIKGQAPKPPVPPAEPASTKPAKKQPNVDESWKKIKAETFLSLEIEGMGQKKLDTLLHEYPTLGDWVELQTEASKKCMHLSKLLPKGVGKKLADSIDDAVMEAFASHSPQE